MLDTLAIWIPGQWEKVLITLLLVGVALLASHLWARYLAQGEISAEKRRIHLVWARNIIWFGATLIIVAVWASTIAGFALSVAAVAAAVLVVSKELVMCVLGYLYVTLVRPYKIGDVIEFSHLHGRVVDIDMFATTLVELDRAGQRTGKVAEFPNGLLLSQPLLLSGRLLTCGMSNSVASVRSLARKVVPDSCTSTRRAEQEYWRPSGFQGQAYMSHMSRRGSLA